jgi:hypothetical protein
MDTSLQGSPVPFFEVVQDERKHLSCKKEKGKRKFV